MPIARFWLYNIGIVGTDFHSKRFSVSQTWLSTDDDHGVAPSIFLFRSIGQQLRQCLGVYAPFDYTFLANAWSEEVFPHQRTIEKPFTYAQPGPVCLNVQAPEAALRLQRVGVTASGSTGVGHIRLPILNDSEFTDLPHRRHVDPSVLQPKVNANLETFAKVVTFGGRTYTNVVFNRRLFTWTPVDHFTVLPSVSRVWQRFRTYSYASRYLNDGKWTGPWF